MTFLLEGGCDCRAIRYRMQSEPLIVHCCHCTWCQRESGASFALNALIEADRVDILAQTPEMIVTPSASGKGQKIHRCPTCRIAVWSNYPGGGDLVRFIRVGTLDDPTACPPDVHIYTSTKQPWVVLPPGARTFDAFYDLDKTWSAASLERRRAMRARAGM